MKTFKYNNDRIPSTLEVVCEELIIENTKLKERNSELLSMLMDSDRAFFATFALAMDLNAGKYTKDSILEAIESMDTACLKKARHTKRCAKTGRFIK